MLKIFNYIMTDIKTIFQNKMFLKYFFMVYGIFIICLIIGLYIGHTNETSTLTVKNYVTNYTSYSLVSTFNDGGIVEIISICVNNSIAFIYMFIMGCIIFDKRIIIGLFGLQTLLLGIVVGGFISKFGILPIICGILPHGIFEITIICMAISYGIVIHIKDFKNDNFKIGDIKTVLKKEFKFVIFGLSLIGVAAIVEVLISTQIIIMLIPK